MRRPWPWVARAEASMLQTVAAPRDGYRAAADGIHLDEYRVHLDIACGDLKTGRHSVQKSLDDRAFLHADHRIVRPRHTDIGDVSGAPGQDLLVRGSHVGVRSD